MKSFNKMIAMLLLTVVSFGANAQIDKLDTGAFLALEETKQITQIETLLTQIKSDEIYKSNVSLGLEVATGIDHVKFYDMAIAANLEHGNNTNAKIVLAVLKANLSAGFMAAAKNGISSVVTAPFSLAYNHPYITTVTSLLFGGVELFRGLKGGKGNTLTAKGFNSLANVYGAIQEKVTGAKAKAAAAAALELKKIEDAKFSNKFKKGMLAVKPYAKEAGKLLLNVGVNYLGSKALNACGVDQKFNAFGSFMLNVGSDLYKKTYNKATGLNQFGQAKAPDFEATEKALVNTAEKYAALQQDTFGAIEDHKNANPVLTFAS